MHPCWVVFAPSSLGDGGVCGSSSWEVECRCLVRNLRPPTPLSDTEFEEVDL